MAEFRCTQEPERSPDHSGSSQDIAFRAYDSADLEALVAFYVDFEPKRAAQGLPPAGEERVRRWLHGVLAQGIHVVATRGGRLIGHAFVVPTERPGTAEYAVFLDASQRGRGLGTQLNRVAVDAARAAGIRRLWLTAEPRNRAAIRSYEKVGFRYRPQTVYSSELEMEMDL